MTLQDRSIAAYVRQVTDGFDGLRDAEIVAECRRNGDWDELLAGHRTWLARRYRALATAPEGDRDAEHETTLGMVEILDLAGADPELDALIRAVEIDIETHAL